MVPFTIFLFPLVSFFLSYLVSLYVYNLKIIKEEFVCLNFIEKYYYGVSSSKIRNLFNAYEKILKIYNLSLFKWFLVFKKSGNENFFIPSSKYIIKFYDIFRFYYCIKSG